MLLYKRYLGFLLVFIVCFPTQVSQKDSQIHVVSAVSHRQPNNSGVLAKGAPQGIQVDLKGGESQREVDSRAYRNEDHSTFQNELLDPEARFKLLAIHHDFLSDEVVLNNVRADDVGARQAKEKECGQSMHGNVVLHAYASCGQDPEATHLAYSDGGAAEGRKVFSLQLFRLFLVFLIFWFPSEEEE